MEKFCGRDMTEPPSQGTHSPAVPANILRGYTSLASSIILVSGDSDGWIAVELASKRGKKQCPFLDSNQGSFHYE
jgi:hypothetical protein